MEFPLEIQLLIHEYATCISRIDWRKGSPSGKAMSYAKELLVTCEATHSNRGDIYLFTTLPNIFNKHLINDINYMGELIYDKTQTNFSIRFVTEISIDAHYFGDLRNEDKELQYMCRSNIYICTQISDCPEYKSCDILWNNIRNTTVYKNHV